MSGPLALVGGDEWTDGCSFDATLLEESGGSEVVVIAAAAAYQRPERVLERAESWFASLGATVVRSGVLARPDALDSDNVAAVAAARFIYLSGGSPMHLRSVLKDTPLFDAMLTAWRGGAVLAGSGAGADVLCDPMVDPRGGAYTVGLGVIPGLAIIPRYDAWSPDKVQRTIAMSPTGIQVAGVPLQTALIRTDGATGAGSSAGTGAEIGVGAGADSRAVGQWRSEGVGQIDTWIDGQPSPLSTLTI